jgi:hypothetical protein
VCLLSKATTHYEMQTTQGLLGPNGPYWVTLSHLDATFVLIEKGLKTLMLGPAQPQARLIPRL